MLKYSALYIGQVRHRRFAPTSHAFTYTMLYFFLDLSEIKRLFRWPFILARRGPAFLAFRRKDYLGNPKQELADSVRQTIQQLLGKTSSGPIRLLTQLSYFGFCFNPISLYYCYDSSDSRVEFIVAHVSNTPWHERHAYAVECTPGQPLHFAVPKNFHVSPFMPMNQTYAWRLSAPGSSLSAHMENRILEQTDPMFDVTMTLQRRPFNATELAKSLFSFPLMTLKAFLAIYWQAILLKKKGLRFYRHPKDRVVQ